MTVAPRRRRRRRRPPSKLCPIVYGSMHLPADPKLTSTNRFDLIFANSLNAKNDYSHKYLLPMKRRTMNLYILYTKSFYATTTIIVPNGANLSICDDLNHCHKYSSE